MKKLFILYKRNLYRKNNFLAVKKKKIRKSPLESSFDTLEHKSLPLRTLKNEIF